MSSHESSSNEDASDVVTPSKKARKICSNGKNATNLSDGTSSDSLHEGRSQPTLRSPEARSNCNGSAQKTRRLVRAGSNAKIFNAIEPLIVPSSVDESASEDEVIPLTPSRKLMNKARSAAVHVKHDKYQDNHSDDLADEVAALDDPDKEFRESRTRGRQANSERSRRQHKLEELRQRRAGVQASTEDESWAGSLGHASESETESVDYAMHRIENLDEYEDEFVDDEDDTLGVDLGVAGVPLEYTYHANKKPFDHFKTEVEWMVHNKLNPAFDRRDEIYQLAHQKLDKEVKGFGSSQYRSAVWKESFLNALKSRPDFFRVDIPTMHKHKCEACQRSGHPPKHKVIFTGKAYNRDTLETIENEDDSDTDTDSDDQNDGVADAGDEESFFLGRYALYMDHSVRYRYLKNDRFCCANAEMAHTLHHWRFSLNQTVLQWLGHEGHLTPAKIVERDSLRQMRRQKEANKIVDRMDETGVMRDLYRQFKENLQAARDSKVC